MTEAGTTGIGPAAPVGITDRIGSLDVLRGFAVLGILVMNIQSFAMPGAAYTNPTAYGDLEGLNGWVWTLSNLFADQKFLSIFSMMFGAGIILMSTHAEQKQQHPASIHYRRMVGLLIIGLAHAYLLWYGDVLVTYAMCGSVAFLLRRKSPRALLIIGTLVFLVPTPLLIGLHSTIPSWPVEQQEEARLGWSPDSELIDTELAAYRGDYLEQMGPRAVAAASVQTFLFLLLFGWKAGGLMLIGMALYKLNVLSAQRSPQFYRRLLATGLVAGLSLMVAGLFYNMRVNWRFDESLFFGFQFTHWGSLGMSLSYIAAVMLICQARVMKAFTTRLAAVGRMAFTNYLMQTIICTTLFYGHGFGLFGSVSRTGQAAIVLAVWVFQLVVSPWWLDRFRFGPAEWLWRSMTYLRLQPLRITS